MAKYVLFCNAVVLYCRLYTWLFVKPYSTTSHLAKAALTLTAMLSFDLPSSMHVTPHGRVLHTIRRGLSFCTIAAHLRSDRVLDPMWQCGGWVADLMSRLTEPGTPDHLWLKTLYCCSICHMQNSLISFRKHFSWVKKEAAQDIQIPDYGTLIQMFLLAPINMSCWWYFQWQWQCLSFFHLSSS